jgi:hypothetical protein
MVNGRLRKDKVRAYMLAHGVKYNVARRAVEHDSQRLVSLEQDKWPSLGAMLNRLLGESLLRRFGELPDSAPAYMQDLEDLHVTDFAFVDDSFSWFKVDGGDRYEAFEGEAQFDVMVGGWATLQNAQEGFRSGTLRPLREPFDEFDYDPNDPDDRVEVVVDRYFPASVSMTVVRLEGSDQIEDQHLSFMWEVAE